MKEMARQRCPVAQAVLILLLVAGPAASAEVRSFEMGDEGPRVWLKMTVALDAPPAAVYAVITDYDRLQDLHQHVVESRLVRRLDAHVADVYTKVRGCVAAIFCRSVARVERLTERPPEELRAEVLPEKSDFAYGVVSWRLLPEAGGTRVEYETEVEPEFWVPKLFGHQLLLSFMKRTTTEMIARIENQARRLTVAEDDPGEARSPPAPAGAEPQ
jgi:uncharacterized protein YndB with AHSA1/START domain